MTKHHVLPRSRLINGNGENGNGNNNGFNRENIIKIPQCFHECWHALFGNMTVAETIDFIQIIFEGKGRKRKRQSWKKEDLYELQLKLQKETILEKKRKARRKM